MNEKNHLKKVGIKKFIAVVLVFCMMVCYFPPFVAKANSTDVQVVGIHKDSTKDNIRIVLDSLPETNIKGVTTYSGFTVDIIGGQVNVEELPVDVTSDADNCITLSIGNYLTEETDYQVTLKGNATDTTTGEIIRLADDLQIHVDSTGDVYEEIPTDLWPGIKHDANSKGELYMQSEDLSSRVDPYEQSTDETLEVVQLPGFEYVTTSNFYDASGVQMADSVTADADGVNSEIIVPYTTLKNSEGTELENHDKTLLSLNVNFEENTTFMTNTNLMVAASTNYVGLLIRPESNDQLRIQTYGGVQSSPTVYYLTTDKVDSMTGGLILQLSFEYGDFDDDGAADDVKLGAYINGATCTAVLDGNTNDGEITSDNHLMFYNCDMTKLGTQMVLNTLNRTEYNTGDITVSKVTAEKPELVALNGFEHVTTSNFFDASGVQMADRVTADAESIESEIIVPYTTLKNSEEEELSSHDKTLLSLKVDFEENTRFMTNSNLMVAASSSYVGLLVRPESNNQLRIQTQGGVQASSTVYYLTTDKVSSMTDEFILQLSFEYGDFDNDNNGTADDVKLGVYINGASCTAEIDGNVADGEITSDNHLMFYNCDMTKLGTQMVLNTLNRTEYNTGDITVSKVTVEKPEPVTLNGFEHVTTSNFYDASGVQMADSVTADADGVNSEIIVPYTTLKNSEGEELSSHDKTLLSLNVVFEENTTFMTNSNVMVAASTNYVGFLVRPESNDQLRIQTYGGVQSSPTVYYLTTDKVTSITDELILQFSFEYGDFDNDNNGTADDVKLGAYINGATCAAELDGNVEDGEITSDNHLMFYNCDMTKLGTQMVLNTLSRAEYSTGDITVSKVTAEDNGSRYTLQPIGMDDGVFIQQADGTEESYSFESFTLKDSKLACLKYSDTSFEDGTIFHIKGTFKLLHTSGACYKNTYNKAICLDVKYQYEDDEWRCYDEIGRTALVPGFQYNAEIAGGYLYMVGTDYTGMLPGFDFNSEQWRLCLKPLNEESGVFRKPSGGEEARMNATDYTLTWPANIKRQFCLGVGNNRTEGDIFTIKGEFEVVTGSGGTYYKDDNYVKVLTIEESNYRYDGTTWTCLSSPKATVKIAGGNTGNASNHEGIYLDSSIEFQLQGWEGAKAIRALSNDDNSGVFLNGVKQTNSYLLETGSEGLFLSIGGATVQNGDKITLEGAFQQDAASADGNKEIVTYEESNFWYGTDIPQKGSEETLSTWYDYPIGTSDITGDIDADGEVNVVDLVRMKRWYDDQRVPIKNSKLSTASHASEESEMIDALCNRILRSDEMPIIGYYGPLAHGWNEAAGVEDVFPNFLTDYYFGLIADAGINTIMYTNDAGNEDYVQFVAKSLEFAEKYGIGYYVWDTSVGNYAGKEEIDKDALKKQIEKYSSYSAFKGLHLVDEPNSENYLPNHFDDKTTEDVVENKYISKHLDLVTALDEINVNTLQAVLPCYDYSESNASLYEQYVDEYCKGFKPNLLTYDHYVFDKLQTNEALEKDVYFWNMGVIRECAEEYNIPFGVTIQAGGQWNDSQVYFESKKPYYPTEGQFNWNVNTCLAFGTKAITYFPLIQPYHFSWAGTAKEDKTFDFYRNGMIGANGQLNDWYYYAQENNKQIAAVDDILMYSENKGLLACGEEAKADLALTNPDYVLEETSFHELSSVEGNALVGCFDFDGKTVLYVVNYDMENSQNITLNFDMTQSLDIIQKAETSYQESTNELVLSMEPGEGALVLIH